MGSGMVRVERQDPIIVHLSSKHRPLRSIPSISRREGGGERLEEECRGKGR